MNKVIMMARLCKNPEVRYGGASNTAIAHFSIAVDRRFKKDNGPSADFFNCTAFGKLGEFVEKYLRKGTKIVLEGEVQNNNYQKNDGSMVYGVQIVCNNIEFAESKKSSGNNNGTSQEQSGDFMAVDETVEDEEIPFS